MALTESCEACLTDDNSSVDMSKDLVSIFFNFPNLVLLGLQLGPLIFFNIF